MYRKIFQIKSSKSLIFFALVMQALIVGTDNISTPKNEIAYVQSADNDTNSEAAKPEEAGILASLKNKAIPTQDASDGKDVTDVKILSKKDKLFSIDMLKDNNYTISPEKSITVASNDSTIYTHDAVIDKIFVTGSKVIHAQMLDSRNLHLVGLGTGDATLFIVSGGEKKFLKVNIRVDHNLTNLKQTLRENVPIDCLEAVSLPNGIMLKGTCETAKDAETAQAIAERFLGTKGNSVLNYINIKNKIQVNLQVKLVEISRNVSSRLGIDWKTTFKNGSVNFGTIPTSPDVSLNVKNFMGVLDALANEGIVKILAEPNLITLSGQSAKFLVGGEYAYAVPQQAGSAANLGISFKSYGTSLAFTPTVSEQGDIILKLNTEVSSLDKTNALNINGTTVPAISTKNVNTVVLLGNGQSLMIAGLLSNTTNTGKEEIGGLANIPLFGALFRTSYLDDNRTELVIIVTPYIVEPLNSNKKFELPGEGITYSDLATSYMTGTLVNRAVPGGVNISETSGFGKAGFYF